MAAAGREAAAGRHRRRLKAGQAGRSSARLRHLGASRPAPLLAHTHLAHPEAGATHRIRCCDTPDHRGSGRLALASRARHLRTLRAAARDTRCRTRDGGGGGSARARDRRTSARRHGVGHRNARMVAARAGSRARDGDRHTAAPRRDRRGGDRSRARRSGGRRSGETCRRGMPPRIFPGTTSAGGLLSSFSTCDVPHARVFHSAACTLDRRQSAPHRKASARTTACRRRQRDERFRRFRHAALGLG